MASTPPEPPVYMLTTYDNPFDPFTQWDEWYVWDMQSGYNTPGLLARVALHSDELSDVDQFHAIQDAIDEIVRENVTGVHRKLKRGEFESLVPALEVSGTTPDASPNEGVR
jgi:hypothetical protein